MTNPVRSPMRVRSATLLLACALALVAQAEAKPPERRHRLVCAGPLCARLQLLPQGGMGATVTTWPAGTNHVNLRCGSHQHDSRTSRYIYCDDRAVSLQHCRKGTFNSTCSEWFVFTMQGADYNPRQRR